MRVLVTGANGFIGRHFVRDALTGTGWEIVALHRSGGAEITDARLTYVWRDLRAPIDATTADLLGDVDVVINLAASSDVPTFLADPAGHTLNNVASTLHLLQWARSQQLKAFIQVSTNEVYGPVEHDARASGEWDPLIPQTPYSASKAAAEMLAIGWQRTYGIPVTIVNTMHVFGEGQPEGRFIPTAIRKILAGHAVPLYRYEQGPAIRNWMYVKDFVHAIRHIAERYAGAHLDRWNVAGPELSCLQVAHRIGKVLGLDVSVRWADEGFDGTRRPGYDHRYALDPAKLANSWFVPPYGFAAGLERTVKYFTTEGEQ